MQSSLLYVFCRAFYTQIREKLKLVLNETVISSCYFQVDFTTGTFGGHSTNLRCFAAHGGDLMQIMCSNNAQ